MPEDTKISEVAPENATVVSKKSLRDDLIAEKNEDLEEGLHQKIVNQINTEYELCWRFMHPKISEWLARLKYYNNQGRKKDKVGDPLIFTVHQTILASLYDDELAVTFSGREKGDEDRAENLNLYAKYSHDEMGKDQHDYFWDFDATFFGRGYSLMNDFDRATKVPMPEIIDPTTMIRDSRATALNGDTFGRNSARFFGREIKKTKYELEGNSSYFNLKFLSKGSSDGSNDSENLRSLIDTARRERRSAAGFEQFLKFEQALDENFEYSITQWFTHFDGKKYIFELANDRKLIIRVVPIKDLDWPVNERTIFPISHEFDGVSIPDMTEDKQRMRAMLTNLGLDVARSELYPMRLFDQNKIKNRNNLNFEFNKWIPVDGPPGDAVQELQTKRISQTVDYIMSILELSAEKATATPAVQQGAVSRQQRTLGEIELVARRSGTRFSLAARIFGWSERRFWKNWYRLVERHTKDEIDEVMIRLAGPFGPKWLPLKRGDLITQNPLGPDIQIESRAVGEARKMRDFQNLQLYFATALQLPTSQKRYAMRSLGRFVLPKDEVDRVFPPTIDEMEAAEENEKLSENDSVPILLEQNHIEHMAVHAMATDTKALRNHIDAHKLALKLARRVPELFPGITGEQGVEIKGQAINALPAAAAPAEETTSPAQNAGAFPR